MAPALPLVLSTPCPGSPLLGPRLSVSPWPSWVFSLSFPAAMQCLYNPQWLLQNCPPTLPDKDRSAVRGSAGTWVSLVAGLVFWGSPGEAAGTTQKRFLSQSLGRRSLPLTPFDDDVLVVRLCVCDRPGSPSVLVSVRVCCLQTPGDKNCAPTFVGSSHVHN